KFHSPLRTLPYVGIVSGLLIVGFATKLIDRSSRYIQILTVVLIGVLLSFVQAGKVNGHYLIQLYPFILIPLGMAVARLPIIKKKYVPFVMVLVTLIPMESYLEYANIVTNKLEKGSFYNGEGI